MSSPPPPPFLSSIAYNPPPVVIASLMSREKPPQLQINRSQDQKYRICEEKRTSRYRCLFVDGFSVLREDDSSRSPVIISSLSRHSNSNVISNVKRDVTKGMYINVKCRRIELTYSILNANMRRAIASPTEAFVKFINLEGRALPSVLLEENKFQIRKG